MDREEDNRNADTVAEMKEEDIAREIQTCLNCELKDCVTSDPARAFMCPINVNQRIERESREKRKEKFVVPGPMPGLNEYIYAERASKYKAASMKKQWSHLIIACARRDLPPRWRPCGRVQIKYTFYEKNRRRDYDNIQAWAIKVIQDSIVSGGWLKSDGQNVVAPPVTAFDVDKIHPRVEVEIEEI